MMTEKALWKFCANLWDKPEKLEIKGRPTPGVHPVHKPEMGNGCEECYGLCQTLARLHHNHDITDTVFKSANDRLVAYLEEHDWKKGYLFPLTTEGASKRAALCLHFMGICQRSHP